MRTEEIIINNKVFIKTTPEEGFKLHKLGTDEYYKDAIDLPNSNFQYEEVEDVTASMEENKDIEELEEVVSTPQPLPEQSE